MTQICECNVGLANLGTPSCTKTIGRPYKIVFTELKNELGVLNSIASGVAIDQAYIDAAVQNVEPKQRWFASSDVKNFLSVKEDTTFYDYDDGTRVELREGRRSFTGMFEFADNVFLGLLNKVKCANSGFYVITETGNILGYSKGDGDTYPIPVDVFVNTLNFQSGDAVQNVSFVLDIPLTVGDSMLSVIYGAEGDLVGIDGLVQLAGTVGTPTATGYPVVLAGAGQYGFTDAYEGAVVGDFSAVDATGTSVTITSVTETPAGTYTFVFAGVATSDVITVSATAVLMAKGFGFADFSGTIA